MTAVAALPPAVVLAAADRRALPNPIRARTVTLVVPFPPGGGVDALARIVGGEALGRAQADVVVENRPGGGGTVGTRAVAKAEPDGYTLMLAHTGTISINPSLYANAGYDPRKDFAPIGLIASMPVALIAHPSFPAKTVADVIAIAKKEPGKLNFGTSAIGTGGYLTAEYFKSVADLDMHDRALSRHGAADERSDRRARAGLVRRAAAGDRQHPGRQAARHRGHRHAALQPVARRADGRGIRPAGLRLPCCTTG